MHFLSPEDILFIHSVILDETGGVHGVRDIGLLMSAAERPKQTFAGKDLYPTLHEKAAALFHSLARFHPFLDGNKRTAISAAGIFLERNGSMMTATNKELELFTLRTVEDTEDVPMIAAWLKKHTKKMLVK